MLFRSHGDILILEHPERDEYGAVLDNLYVAGIDSIDQGKEDSTGQSDTSDFCIVIKRRAHGLKEPQYVAMYKARPNDIRFAYGNAMRMLEYYGCKAVLEATRINFKEFLKQQNKLHLLMKRPRSTMTNYGGRNAPGQQGANKRRKTSEYGIQLREKQKAKYTYGVLEKQFRNLFEKASRTKGIKGEVLLQFLESRLDNIVYRLGIAPTRAAARQLVLHRHINVNGKTVNIPSYSVKPGEVISVREKSKSLEVIADSLAGFNHSKYPWIEWDESIKGGKMLHLPQREDIPENIKEQLIVELYSK